MLFPSNTASPEPTAAKISDKRRLDPSIAHAALSTADAPVDINADRFSSSSPPFLNRSPKPEGSRQLATNTQEPESNGPDTNNNWADAAISAAAEAIDSHKVKIPDGVREPSTESGWEQMRDGNPLGVEAEVAGDSDMVMEAPGTEDGGSPATTGNVDTGTEGMSGDVESRSSGNPFVLVDDDEERSIEIAPFTKPTATLAASPILTPNEPVAQRTRPAEPSKPNIGATRANQQPTDLEAAPVHNPFDEIYGPGSGINATGDPVGALRTVMTRYRLSHDALPAGVRRAVYSGSNVERGGTDQAAQDPAQTPVASRPELELGPYKAPVAALKAAIASNQPSPAADLRRVESSRRVELIRAGRRSEGGKVGNKPVGVPSVGSSASTWPGFDPYSDPAAELKAATARNCPDSDGPSNGIRGTVTFRPTHAAAGASRNDQSEVGSVVLEHTAMTTAPTVEVAETEHDDQSQVSSSRKRKCHSNAAQSIAVEVDLTPVTPGEVFEAEGSPGMSHVIGDGSADSPVMLDSDDEGDGDGGGPKSNPASA
ncbi:hypothetical protein NpPPO83_00010600 [Neofusicoccum parvum]|uniref:Uncharacterized protein n=1 Tax=Neofusicoccum parvum TaxID=310453 RepID=A0ACB5SM30_9PEZI|nr:hypothetical protein NpPPO83_00010600 [Neofusicoccum parvum]